MLAIQAIKFKRDKNQVVTMQADTENPEPFDLEELIQMIESMGLSVNREEIGCDITDNDGVIKIRPLERFIGNWRGRSCALTVYCGELEGVDELDRKEIVPHICQTCGDWDNKRSPDDPIFEEYLAWNQCLQKMFASHLDSEEDLGGDCFMLNAGQLDNSGDDLRLYTNQRFGCLHWKGIERSDNELDDNCRGDTER